MKQIYPGYSRSRGNRQLFAGTFWSVLALAALLFGLTVAAGLFSLHSTTAAALTTVPTKMNFQGRLTDSAGNIKPNGTYNMKLKLYTVASAGSSVWSEDRLVSATQGVTVTNGLFSIQLGSITTLPASLFGSGSLYLEVELPTPATATSASPAWSEGPMSPRNQLATSAYAYNAETLDGLDSSAFAASSGSGSYIQNTTSPQTADFNITGSGVAANFKANLFDTATASTLSIGTNNATNIELAKDTTVAAAKTITMVGGITSLRPVAPVEGMIYYDTSTKQLLTYANGKWQADRSTTTKIVAASNSSQAAKDAADYVANGEIGDAQTTLDGDQVEINAALTAAAGGKVYLMEGTYKADATILVPNNTTLAGAGQGTVIEFADIDVSDRLIENSDVTTGTGVTVQDMKIDGRKDLNTAGSHYGIYMNNMGAANARTGARINNVTVANFSMYGIRLYQSSNNVVSGNTSRANDRGISLSSSSSNIMSNNEFESNTGANIELDGSADNKLTDNISRASTTWGVYLSTNSDRNTITGNTVKDNGADGIYADYSQANTISDNIISNNAGNGINLAIMNNNIVSNNRISDSSGVTSNGGIRLSSADSNTITSNQITDSSATTDNYAIDIANANSDTNYLADNNLSSGSINDSGTGTIYGGQLDGSGKLLSRSSGGSEIQSTSGTAILSVDAVNQRLTVGSGALVATKPGEGFSIQAKYPTNTTPRFVAPADVNADGNIDLITSNYNTNTVSVLLGTGSGSFGAKTDYATGSSARDLAIGDFSGDGKPDIAVANNLGNTVSVLINTGTGTFGAKTDYVTGTGASGVATSDFNGDGKLDLVVANTAASGTVSVFIGTGTGTFGAKTDFTTAANPASVAVADFNGDGKSDIVTNSGAGVISVLLGTGTGSFGTKTDYAAGTLPGYVATGDFNGDGKPDIAVANNNASSLSILLNNGSGAFGTATGYAGNNASYVSAYDFNGDRMLDIVTADFSTKTVSVFSGSGNGSFSTPKSYPVGKNSQALTVGDFNNDGRNDIASASFDEYTVSILLNQNYSTQLLRDTVSPAKIQVIGDATQGGLILQGAANTGSKIALLQAQDSTGKVLLSLSPDGKLVVGPNAATRILTKIEAINFAAKSDYTTGTGPVVVTSADFNGDGNPDIATANATTSNVSVLLGSSTGVFGAKTDYSIGVAPTYIAAADFNADGKVDLVTANSSANTVSVMIGTGTGTFGTNTDYAAGTGPYAVVAADFNGDGKLDLATANNTAGTLSVFIGTGTGTFGAKTDYATGANPRSITVGDFNADGKKDLATGNYTANTLSVLIGTGTGTFGAKTDYATGVNPRSIIAVDVSSDGKTDLVTANYTAGTVSVLIGTGTGTFGTNTDTVAGVNLNSIISGDFNGDNKLDLALANGVAGVNVVSILPGIGAGSFGAKTEYTTASNAASVVTGDFNRDGLVDLAVSDQSSAQVSILINTTTQTSIGTVSLTTTDKKSGGLYINGSLDQVAPLLSLQDAKGSELFRVDAAGNISAVGATSITNTLTVSSSQSTAYVTTISNTSTTTTADGLLINLGVANASRTTGNYFIGFAGANTVAGKIQGGASAVAYTTTAADYAEYFRADPTDLPKSGELVALEPTRPSGVRRATGNDLVTGIISTNPGFVGNGPLCQVGDEDCDTNYAKDNVLVSLVGQVPLKVTGDIRIGDALGASTIPGIAAKVNEGSIVGYALTASENGMVQVLIRPGVLNPASGTALQGGNGVFSSLVVNGVATVDSLVVTGDATVLGDLYVEGHLIAKGGKPTISAGPALGVTTTSVSVEGVDGAGTATLTAGAQQQTSGVLAHISFSKAFNSTYKVTLSSMNENATDLRVYIVKTATGFDIVTRDVPQAGQTYEFDYIVMGAKN